MALIDEQGICCYFPYSIDILTSICSLTNKAQTSLIKSKKKKKTRMQILFPIFTSIVYKLPQLLLLLLANILPPSLSYNGVQVFVGSNVLLLQMVYQLEIYVLSKMCDCFRLLIRTATLQLLKSKCSNINVRIICLCSFLQLDVPCL